MKPISFLIHVLTGCSIMAVGVAKADALDEWHWRSPLPQGNDLRAIAYGDGVFVTVGAALTILRSTNAVDWTSHGFNRPFRPDLGNSSLSGVTFTDGKFVAVGYEYGPDDVKGLIYLSSDGIHWTLTASPPNV